MALAASSTLGADALHLWTFENPAPYDDGVGDANLTPSASGVSLFDTGNTNLGQAVRIGTSGILTAPIASLGVRGTHA